MATIQPANRNRTFSVNDTILCYEPDPMKARVLYEAKVIDVDQTKDEHGNHVPECYVHFQGWNKKWDRWVLEDQILSLNDENRELQSKLFKEVLQPTKKSKVKKDGLDEEKDNKSLVSANSYEIEDEVKLLHLPVVTLDIPKALALRLEDDCYCIQRKKKLIRLPRKPCVTTILNGYYVHCQMNDNMSSVPNIKPGASLKIVGEMIEGLNTYFNFFLSRILLYTFEQEQYNNFFPTVAKDLLNVERSVCESTAATPMKATSAVLNALEGQDSIAVSKLITTPRRSLREKHKRSSDETQDDVKGTRRQKEPKISSSTVNTSPVNCNKTSSFDALTNESPSKPIDRETRSKRFPCHETTHTIKSKESTKELRRSTRRSKQTYLPETEILPVGSTAKSIHDSTSDHSSQLEQSQSSFMAYPQTADGETPSDLYGVEHFLRLFVKLPSLLAASGMDRNHTNLLLSAVAKLLEYLSQQQDLYCDDVYCESIV